MNVLESMKSKIKFGTESSIDLCISLEVFVKRKTRKYFLDSEIAKLQNKDFVIISNNCFGGEAYQMLKLPYNTPFVGLFLYGPCYLKLLQNFDFYLQQDLVFINKSVYKESVQTYPIALLYDVELHFLHYKSQDEVLDKWNRRLERLKKRINKADFFFQISDQDLIDRDIIIAFHKLDFKNKLSFAAFDIEGLTSEQHVNVYKSYNRHKKSTPNGKKLFEISFLYIDFIQWLNTKKNTRTRFKS